MSNGSKVGKASNNIGNGTSKRGKAGNSSKRGKAYKSSKGGESCHLLVNTVENRLLVGVDSPDVQARNTRRRSKLKVHAIGNDFSYRNYFRISYITHLTGLSFSYLPYCHYPSY